MIRIDTQQTITFHPTRAVAQTLADTLQADDPDATYEVRENASGRIYVVVIEDGEEFTL